METSDWADEKAKALYQMLMTGDDENWKAEQGRIAAALRAARDEGLERGAEIAADCYHGPYDHGCNHGNEIAAAIRAEKSAAANEEG